MAFRKSRYTSRTRGRRNYSYRSSPGRGRRRRPSRRRRAASQRVVTHRLEIVTGQQSLAPQAIGLKPAEPPKRPLF